MKLKNLIQRIFCKDLLDRVAKLEGNVTNIRAERDDLSDKLKAAELAYNMLLTEYNFFRANAALKSTAKVASASLESFTALSERVNPEHIEEAML